MLVQRRQRRFRRGNETTCGPPTVELCGRCERGIGCRRHRLGERRCYAFSGDRGAGGRERAGRGHGTSSFPRPLKRRSRRPASGLPRPRRALRRWPRHAAPNSAPRRAHAERRWPRRAPRRASSRSSARWRSRESTGRGSADGARARGRGLVAARERGAEALLSALETEPGKRLAGHAGRSGAEVQADRAQAAPQEAPAAADRQCRRRGRLLSRCASGARPLRRRPRRHRLHLLRPRSPPRLSPRPSTRRRRVRPTGKRALRRRPESTLARIHAHEYVKGVNTGKRPPVTSPARG